LLVPEFRRLAGICLIALLVGMFTANVHAARRGVTLRGKPPTPLWLRAPMQILFVALLWWSTRPGEPASSRWAIALDPFIDCTSFGHVWL
jgi:uncharacterized membrane protein